MPRTKRDDSTPAEPKPERKRPDIFAVQKLSRDDCEAWAGIWQMISCTALGDPETPEDRRREGVNYLGMSSEEALALAQSTEKASESLPGYGKLIHSIISGGKGLEAIFVPVAIIGIRVVAVRAARDGEMPIQLMLAGGWAQKYLAERAAEWKAAGTPKEDRERERLADFRAEVRERMDDSAPIDGTFATV